MEEKSENSEKETIDLSSPIMPLREQQSSNLAMCTPKLLSVMCWMVFLCVKFFFSKLLTCVIISFDPQNNQYTSILDYTLIHVCGCMY